MAPSLSQPRANPITRVSIGKTPLKFEIGFNLRRVPLPAANAGPVLAASFESRYKPVMRQYLDLLQHILDHGTDKSDRTGTGTRSIFGYQMRFDLGAGFPLVTTKKLHLRSIIHELLWFLRGDTNIAYLKENGVSIWDDWADADGNLGPVYGSQWRSWRGADGECVDQISQLIESIKTNPDSRRLLVSAWNVPEIPRMKLPPATRCSSSMWPRVGCPASCTNAAPMCSWACPSISLLTRC